MQRVYSVIGKHFRVEHALTPENIIKNFKDLKQFRGKLECLIFEMLLIKNKRLKLNTKADSIRAKRVFAKYSISSSFYEFY